MPADNPPPESDDTGITRRPSQLPPDPVNGDEPLTVEPVDPGEHIFLAELAEPYEDDRPRQRRVVRRAPPPGPPHPGFWWVFLWVILMYIVAQFVPAFAVIIILAVIEAIRAGGPEGAMTWLQGLQKDKSYMLPMMGAVEFTMVISGWTALRLVVGRDWRRQVALRLPTLTHTLLAVIAWPALAIGASGVYLALEKGIPGLKLLPDYLVTTAFVLGAAGGTWVLVRAATGRDWTKVLARQGPAIQLAVTAIACLLVIGLGTEIFHLFRPHLPTFDMIPDGVMTETVKDVRNWPPILGVVIVGLGPGLGEELWCRAFFGRGLVGRHGVVMGVVLTSFFFGAIHVDPHQGLMAVTLGLALHFSYLMTRSLCIPMLLHFLVNSLSVIGDKLQDALPGGSGDQMKNIDAAPEAIPKSVLIAAACLIAAVGWAMYASRGRLVRTDGSGKPPWQPPFAGVAHPPANSGTAVVYSWPGLLPTLAVIVALVGFAYTLFGS